MDLEKVRANVEILQFCKTKMAEVKQMQEVSRAAIEEALGDNEIGLLDGLPVIAFKHVESRRLDQKVLKEKYPEIAEHCTRVTESRRFEVL